MPIIWREDIDNEIKEERSYAVGNTETGQELY